MVGSLNLRLLASVYRHTYFSYIYTEPSRPSRLPSSENILENKATSLSHEAATGKPSPEYHILHLGEKERQNLKGS